MSHLSNVPKDNKIRYFRMGVAFTEYPGNENGVIHIGGTAGEMSLRNQGWSELDTMVGNWPNIQAVELKVSAKEDRATRSANPHPLNLVDTGGGVKKMLENVMKVSMGRGILEVKMVAGFAYYPNKWGFEEFEKDRAWGVA